MMIRAFGNSPSNLDERIGAVAARKPKIHQGDIGVDGDEIPLRPPSRSTHGHKKHVRLRAMIVCSPSRKTG